MSTPPLRIAFVVPEFPVPTETFIVNQVADLLDRGVDVRIFAFRRGDPRQVSARHAQHGMARRTFLLAPPATLRERLLAGPGAGLRLLAFAPRALAAALRRLGRGRNAGGLALLFAAGAVAGWKPAVVHCHFGDCAVRFLGIRRALGLAAPLVTTFYGYDASRLLREAPAGYFDDLQRECSLFYAMSEDMRGRLVAHGFPTARIRVNPAGVDLASHPFAERSLPAGTAVEFLAVGRLVEKKGFDVLLEAFAIARRESAQPLRLTIVGDGPLEGPLRRQAGSLGLADVVTFLGPLRVEEVVALMSRMHLLVAPSRTAADGDME